MNEKSYLNKIFFFCSPIILLKKFKIFDPKTLLDCTWKLKKLEYSYRIKPKKLLFAHKKIKKIKVKL